jgi:3-dehydroquinate synthase
MPRTHTIAVRTPSAAYDIKVGSGLLASVGKRFDDLLDGALANGKRRAFLITSPEIWALHGPALASGFDQSPRVVVVPAGEEHKRLATVERLANELSSAGANRDSVLLAFGGGVIGDLTGFLAASYMRGIPYIQVPTTALAQIDSSIGGKTGVNLAAGKNLLGAFYHPLAVYADIDTLATLPPRELRAGLQEAVKAGIIRSAALFEFLEANATAILKGEAEALTHVIVSAARVKAQIVSRDEHESGLRMILNLGHTLGHAIEAATEYKQLLHGEAVAWGMLAAIRLAERRDLVSAEEVARTTRLIAAFGPLRPFTATVDELVALTAKDKKNRGGMRTFVLPVGIGAATVVNDVTQEQLYEATGAMMAAVSRAASRQKRASHD